MLDLKSTRRSCTQGLSNPQTRYSASDGIGGAVRWLQQPCGEFSSTLHPFMPPPTIFREAQWQLQAPDPIRKAWPSCHLCYKHRTEHENLLNH